MILLKWLFPPRIKVLEALGAIVDGRVEFVSAGVITGAITTNSNDSSSEQINITARVYSSSRGKFYTVEWNPTKNAVMSNDNGSYWKGYLGYPSIAVLMLKKVLPYNERLAQALRRIPWKDINQKYKNDFTKTEQEVFKVAASKGVKEEELIKEADSVLAEIKKKGFELLGKKTKPPEGY